MYSQQIKRQELIVIRIRLHSNSFVDLSVLKYLLFSKKKYIYLYLSISVLYQWPLIPSSLTLHIIINGSRENGAIHEKKFFPSLHISVVAIGNGALGLPSATVG